MDVIVSSERDEQSAKASKRVSALISQFNNIQQTNEVSSKSSSFRIPNKIPKVENGHRDVVRSQSMSHHDSSASETNCVQDLHLKWQKNPKSRSSEDAKENGVRRFTFNTNLPLEKESNANLNPEVLPKTGLVINTKNDFEISSKQDANLSTQSVTSAESSPVTFRTITPWSQIRNTIDKSYIAKSTMMHSSVKDGGSAPATASRSSLKGTTVDADQRWKKNHFVKMVKQGSLDRTFISTSSPTSVTSQASFERTSASTSSPTSVTSHASFERTSASTSGPTSVTSQASLERTSVSTSSPTSVNSQVSLERTSASTSSPMSVTSQASLERTSASTSSPTCVTWQGSLDRTSASTSGQTSIKSPDRDANFESLTIEMDKTKLASGRKIHPGVESTRVSSRDAAIVHSVGLKKNSSHTSEVERPQDISEPSFKIPKVSPDQHKSSSPQTFNGSIEPHKLVSSVVSSVGPNARESVKSDKMSVFGERKLLSLTKPLGFSVSNQKKQPLDQAKQQVLIEASQAKTLFEKSSDQSMKTESIVDGQTIPQGSIIGNKNIKPSDILTKHNNKTKSSHFLTGYQTKPSDFLTGDQTKPSDIPTGDQTKPLDILTGIQTKQSDILTGDETKLTDILTVDQAKSSDILTSDQTKPSDILTSDQTKPSDIITGYQTKPSHFLTGDQTESSDILTGDQTMQSDILTGDQTTSTDPFKNHIVQQTKLKSNDLTRQASSPSDCQTKRQIFRKEYSTNILTNKTQETPKVLNGMNGTQIKSHLFLTESKTKSQSSIDGRITQEFPALNQERPSPDKMVAENHTQTSQKNSDGISSHYENNRDFIKGYERSPETQNADENVTLRPKATSMPLLNNQNKSLKAMFSGIGNETYGGISARQELTINQGTDTCPDNGYTDKAFHLNVQDLHTAKVEYCSATERINHALLKLKTELMSMHEQDLILLKQLINISQNIQKLQRSRVLRVSKSLSFSSGLLHPQPLHLQKRSLSSSLVRQNSAPFNMDKRRQLFSLMRSSTEQLSDGSLSSFDESEFDSQSEMDESSPSLTSSYPYLSPKSNRARPVFQYCSSQMSLCVDVAEDPDQTYEDILKRNVRLWKMSLHGQAPVIQEITCLL